VFGSGLAIVPFLYGGVVQQFHWLTERQFLDAVAVAMITPGPVVITVAFIGYLVAGPLAPLPHRSVFFSPATSSSSFRRSTFGAPTITPRKSVRQRRIRRRHRSDRGAGFVLGKRAIVDVTTALIANRHAGDSHADEEDPGADLDRRCGAAGPGSVGR
jgi:chromate transporter